MVPGSGPALKLPVSDDVITRSISQRVTDYIGIILALLGNRGSCMYPVFLEVQRLHEVQKSM